MTNEEKRIFFNQLAIEAGYTDNDSARKFYYAFIRLVGRTVNKNSLIKLPDFGDFIVKIHKARRIQIDGLNTDKFETERPPVRVMTFKPDNRLKKHLNSQF